VAAAAFHATWAEQLHVSEPEVVARVAEQAGLSDGRALVEGAGTPEIKAPLREQTDAAIADGLFGVPDFEVEGEHFWGYDDLPYPERFLAGEDTLDPAPAQLWDAGPPRPSAMRRRFRQETPPSWQHEAADRDEVQSR
jgi:hypothetical protein